MGSCHGYQRHWFSIYGQAYLRSPVCVRCGAPNPRPLTDDELDDLADFVKARPRWAGGRVAAALREAGR